MKNFVILNIILPIVERLLQITFNNTHARL